MNMNIDTKLADKRHDQFKEFFHDWNGRLREYRKRLEEEERQPAGIHEPQNIRAKLRETELKLQEYEKDEPSGWDEISSVIEGMFAEIDSMFHNRQPIRK